MITCGQVHKAPDRTVGKVSTADRHVLLCDVVRVSTSPCFVPWNRWTGDLPPHFIPGSLVIYSPRTLKLSGWETMGNRLVCRNGRDGERDPGSQALVFLPAISTFAIFNPSPAPRLVNTLRKQESRRRERWRAHRAHAGLLGGGGCGWGMEGMSFSSILPIWGQGDRRTSEA